MSAIKEIKFPKPIKGFVGAKLEVIDGQEVWVKIAPRKQAKGVRKMPQLLEFKKRGG